MTRDEPSRSVRGTRRPVDRGPAIEDALQFRRTMAEEYERNVAIIRGAGIEPG